MLMSFNFFLSFSVTAERQCAAIRAVCDAEIEHMLKTTFEDVFPAEATSVEEYLQQVLVALQIEYI